MSMELAELLKGVNETNEQIGALLTRLNEGAPSSVTIHKDLASPGDATNGNASIDSMVQKRIMDEEELQVVRDALRKKTSRELHMLFAKQSSRQDTGVPLHTWLAAGGYSAQERYAGAGGGLQAQLDPNLQKAADTTSAAALIRQDLEPILYELFVRTFPLFDRIPRIPANGLVHAYNQMTSYGDADWIGELDTVTDDRGTYVRQFTNVGILATRRGVSLKSQFAVLQGGAGFNPERLELQAGLRAMSSRYQKTILHGNWSDPAGTLNTEVGPYDDDSFDGLRKILNSASVVNVDPATNPATSGSLRRAFDAAVLPITEAGGTPTALFGAPAEQITFDEQQDEKTRIIVPNQVDIGVGVRAQEVNILTGSVPFGLVKGNAISNYTTSNTDGSFNGGEDVRDIYFLDESTISLPYLGSEGPTVLDIPIGISGQLTHLYIIFGMWGLAVKAPTFSNKIRVKTSAFDT